MQEILISKQNDNKIIALVEDGKLQEVYEEKEDTSRLEGNIYLGIVKDVLPGMQAAFVDIGEEKNTFLHLKDLMPKASKITGNKNEDLEKYNIKDYIKREEAILVQVKKDATQIKGAKITTDIQIPGRFFVVLPNEKFITVSQKIEDDNERKRLKRIAEEATENKVGIIIRTAAMGKDVEILKQDIRLSIEKWNKLRDNFRQSSNSSPKVLLQNTSIIEKILLDTSDNGLEKVYVDDEKMQEDVNKILKSINKDNVVKVEYKQTNNLLDMYDIDDQIEETKSRKIWLKCGGFITIDKTEALTAIDVNSGKFTGKQNLEQTVLKVNEEASIEIAKQLRLRDIGGIIIIDYIDMHDDESRQKVLETLNNALKKDRSKTQIIEFTKLNLLELTRKHMFSN